MVFGLLTKYQTTKKGVFVNTFGSQHELCALAGRLSELAIGQPTYCVTRKLHYLKIQIQTI